MPVEQPSNERIAHLQEKMDTLQLSLAHEPDRIPPGVEQKLDLIESNTRDLMKAQREELDAMDNQVSCFDFMIVGSSTKLNVLWRSLR